MDWLEEKIEKLKEHLKNTSLVKSLIGYMCITSIGAVVLWMFTRNICNLWIEVIGTRLENVYYFYPDIGGKYAITQEKKYNIILIVLSFINNYSLGTVSYTHLTLPTNSLV